MGLGGRRPQLALQPRVRARGRPTPQRERWQNPGCPCPGLLPCGFCLLGLGPAALLCEPGERQVRGG